MLKKKFMQNLKGLGIAQTILKKKSKVVGLILPDFKRYYKDAVIKQCGTDTGQLYRLME